MRATTLTASYLLDWAIGDPEALPHPVRVIGTAVSTGERFLRPRQSEPIAEFIGGAFLTGLVVAGSALAVSRLLRIIEQLSPRARVAAEVWLGASCLATRNLLDEAAAVVRALENSDLDLARSRLSRIVGRDTGALDAGEVARAVIETLAESLCDGVIAPLTYLALGGVSAAIAYKAVNTLDSMIGHKDEEYEWFGKAAARLDDAANFIPARIAAGLVCAATSLLEPANLRSSWASWRRDGMKHASPNAGQTESAMAGALRIRLGGVNIYTGERIEKPFLGAEFSAPDARHARKALHVTALASVLGFAAAWFLLSRRRNA